MPKWHESDYDFIGPIEHIYEKKKFCIPKFQVNPSGFQTIVFLPGTQDAYIEHTNGGHVSSKYSVPPTQLSEQYEYILWVSSSHKC